MIRVCVLCLVVSHLNRIVDSKCLLYKKVSCIEMSTNEAQLFVFKFENYLGFNLRLAHGVIRALP